MSGQGFDRFHTLPQADPGSSPGLSFILLVLSPSFLKGWRIYSDVGRVK
ncbi:MAG: hypothetical protein RRA15_11280 [bacterium]|nr:hypothetical protein [bacterium]MDT8367048.1 hypothetical protein [bacterium]